MPTVKDVIRSITNLLDDYDKFCRTHNFSQQAPKATGISYSNPDAYKLVSQFLESPSFFNQLQTLEDYAIQHPANPGPAPLYSSQGRVPTQGFSPQASHDTFKSRVSHSSTTVQTQASVDSADGVDVDSRLYPSRTPLGTRTQAIAEVSNVSAVVTPRNLSPNVEQLAKSATKDATPPGKSPTPHTSKPTSPCASPDKEERDGGIIQGDHTMGVSKGTLLMDRLNYKAAYQQIDDDDAFDLSRELFQMFTDTILPIFNVRSEQWERYFEPRHAEKPLADHTFPFAKHYQLDKIMVFFRAFSVLLPALGGKRFMLDWWDAVFQRIFTLPNNCRTFETECRTVVLHLLKSIPPTYAQCEGSNEAEWAWFLGKTLVDLYLTTCNNDIGYSRYLGGATKRRVDSLAGSDALRPSLGEKSRLAINLEYILNHFGQTQPKPLYTLCYEALIYKPELRFAALAFLNQFTCHRQSNKHIMYETSLLDRILQLLETTTFLEEMDACTNIIIFVIPYLGKSLIELLPRLLFIMGRRLAWPLDNTPDLNDPDDLLHSYLFRPLSRGTITLFSFLYGPFPFNTTAFLRNPQVYMEGWVRSQSLDDATKVLYDTTAFDTPGFHSQAEKLVRTHVYHPNFLSTTSQVIIRARPVLSESPDHESYQQTPGTRKGAPFVVSPYEQDIEAVNQMHLPERLELDHYPHKLIAKREPLKFIELCLDLQVETVRKEWEAYFESATYQNESEVHLAPNSSKQTRPTSEPEKETPPPEEFVQSHENHGITVPLLEIHPTSLPGRSDPSFYHWMDPSLAPPEADQPPKTDSPVQMTSIQLPPDSGNDDTESKLYPGATTSGNQPAVQKPARTLALWSSTLDSGDLDPHISKLADGIVQSYQYCITKPLADTPSNETDRTSASPLLRSTDNDTKELSSAAAAGYHVALYRLVNQLQLERFLSECRVAQLGRTHTERIARANAEVAEQFQAQKVRMLQERLEALKKSHPDTIDQEYDMQTFSIGRDKRQLDRGRMYREDLQKKEAEIAQLKETIQQLKKMESEYRAEVHESQTRNFQLQCQLETNQGSITSVKDYRDQVEKLTALLMVSKHGLDEKEQLEEKHHQLESTTLLLQNQVSAGERRVQELQAQLSEQITVRDNLQSQLEHVSQVHNQCAEQVNRLKTTLTAQVDHLQQELDMEQGRMRQVAQQNAELRLRLLSLDDSSLQTEPTAEIPAGGQSNDVV
ncbi:hypothetical protein IWQ62_002264 [Dispira parvispora]|uniref:Hamartin n=1 Tax=Dispira parvispora TaxID=1520584 RepID=A0A9W8AW25_9FUNG|nr:hypothetical protein IWQ62_002264 [Dispira parvispora]